MSLTFLYRDLDATDTDITPYVVLRFGQNPQGMAENAEERSVGSWDLEIEDEGVLDLHAQRTFYVLEDDTYDADNVLWVGQTFDKHSGRGDTWRTGPGRVYTLNLIDLNTLLERRVIQAGDDPDRPEETDVERMLWLQGLGYIGVTDDWISTADPVDMDAVDYTGRMAAEVTEDCMGQSGKNCFMFRDPDTDIFAVYYGDSSADTDILTSDIRLSNVLSDIDNVTTFEVNLDADQWEANSRIYSGIFASYDGGAVYQENATTVANFSHRDTTLSWPDVKTATKANARAIRYLADIGTEEIRITASLEVPSTQVGLFPHAGWRLQARFSHYPLFAAAFTWFRILSRNTTLIGPNRYRVQYELSPGTSPSPPLACLTVVSGLSVQQDSLNGQGPANIGASVTGGTTPYLALVYLAIGNNDTFLNGSSTTMDATASGWTNPLSQPFGIAGHTMTNVAFRSDAAGNPLFLLSDGTNPCVEGVQLAVIIPGGTVVQTSSTLGGGGITWGSPLTPGNMVILGRTAEGPSGFTIDPTVDGNPWDQTLTNVNGPLQAAGSNMGLYAQCVTADMGGLFPGVSSTSWWFHAVEISLT